ncbi:hypothetical protein JANAI62_25790 [Jannaschia pagri]|uniref:Uncharacterized protein n=1 Tax=Jannaschia pagri TaxID=2829797 RepID=A0ABQ4NNN5_9RHOB|nr:MULTISPECIES: hypothetical protein [unclassified Jannaschia]GIT92121.1 hypothetical protein JANAI61_25790 [Jannaschia sp. AI_61]GIT95956.1 hypothetical protein JANAI62_25790 [Jannaschia sp. AI_62]
MPAASSSACEPLVELSLLGITLEASHLGATLVAIVGLTLVVAYYVHRVTR